MTGGAVVIFIVATLAIFGMICYTAWKNRHDKEHDAQSNSDAGSTSKDL